MFDLAQEMPHVEGFGNVIIGAVLQTVETIRLGVFCRKNQDANICALGTAFNIIADRDSRHFWHHDVENDHIGMMVIDHGIGIVGGKGAHEVIGRLLQHFGEQPVDLGIVINDQNLVWSGCALAGHHMRALSVSPPLKSPAGGQAKMQVAFSEGILYNTSTFIGGGRDNEIGRKSRNLTGEREYPTSPRHDE